MNDFALESPGGVEIRREAVLSACLEYRYRLSRVVSAKPRTACFIMLNPSTADAHKDDNTIRRCMSFARSWDCGTLVVVNLFAYRSTDPYGLLRVADPIGPKNMDYLLGAACNAHVSGGPVVCAWGAHGSLRGQDRAVLDRLRSLEIPAQCLGITAEGFPKHPLYLANDTGLTPYSGRPLKGD